MENLTIKQLGVNLLTSTNKVESNLIRKEIKKRFESLEFSTMGKAKRETTLSYIGSINSSSKIEKNLTKNYFTYIVYLSPSTISGFNTCSMASEGCISACLHSSGRVIMDTKQTIHISRLLKTLLFYYNRNFFNSWLFTEIEKAQIKATKNSANFSVRLNGTSDLSVKLFNKNKVNVLDAFKDVQFYDYTKVFNRLGTEKSNMHYTFSYSENNKEQCIKALSLGYNVAVPFLEKLPTTFLNHKVINADETDLRFLDESNVICGLKVKRIKDKEKMQLATKKGFIVDAR